MSEYAAKLEDFTVKLVEIVRCRDCKYYEAVPEDPGDWCGYWTDRVYKADDGFCAWGEKKVVGE